MFCDIYLHLDLLMVDLQKLHEIPFAHLVLVALLTEFLKFGQCVVQLLLLYVKKDLEGNGRLLVRFKLAHYI